MILVILLKDYFPAIESIGRTKSKPTELQLLLNKFFKIKIKLPFRI